VNLGLHLGAQGGDRALDDDVEQPSLTPDQQGCKHIQQQGQHTQGRTKQRHSAHQHAHATLQRRALGGDGRQCPTHAADLAEDLRKEIHRWP
jgi:hypothetical protein